MNAMFEKRKDEDFVRNNITPKTNADVIRGMSDEELAKFLRRTVWEEGANLFDCADYTCGCACEECPTYLQWLKSEVEE